MTAVGVSRRIIAVIDVGSNSVRLLVARELSPVAFEVVDEERFGARLGEGQSEGQLSPEGVERGIRALRIMTQVARSHRPDALAVVGTEALRRAPNASRFLARARAEAEVEVRILSGHEEAAAAFLGVVNSTNLRDGHVLDIGGGSLEVMRVESGALAEVQSAPLGAIYARDTYLRADPPPARDVRALRRAVRQQIRVPASGDGQPLIATGGSIRSLARMVRLKHRDGLRRIHGSVISHRDLHRLAATLITSSLEARRPMPGLNGGRVDTLPAAAVVIDEVMALMGASSLTVSGQGLREGLVWQELRGESPVIPDVRLASIAGLARANGVDEAAAEPVVAAAARLFEATAPVHGLPTPDSELLLAAARLAGIGMHIDYYNRDRHAEYLVHSGDLRGFSHREIVLLAALVRHAQGGTPDLSPYADVIGPDDARVALILATLLGVAQAIHRRCPSPVSGIDLTCTPALLHVALRASGPVDAEIYEVERHQKRFESVLRLSLAVSSRLEPPAPWPV